MSGPGLRPALATTAKRNRPHQKRTTVPFTKRRATLAAPLHTAMEMNDDAAVAFKGVLAEVSQPGVTEAARCDYGSAKALAWGLANGLEGLVSPLRSGMRVLNAPAARTPTVAACTRPRAI